MSTLTTRSQDRTTLSLTASDGTELALHHWAPRRPPTAAVFYVHGIQSHAGWLFETGPELAARGLAVFALDRRGSGTSGGPRGHLPSVAQILDDYANALAAVRAQVPDVPLTVVGQSFGGSILAALVTEGHAADARLVFCAPALGQQRSRHGSGEALSALRSAGGLSTAPLTLADTDYTDVTAYLDFMANDILMIRQVTASTRSVMVQLEDVYMRGGTWDAGPPAHPVHFVRPQHDAIIDLDTSWQVLTGLTRRAVPVDLTDSGHYVEFSAARRRYWDWLAATATGRTR
ncbi:alpha/beta hydrolase [Streptomyces sp. NBC_00847]|uniref:alpha/beta hydrolase n=1 Tax=Streptomyces sp. NBC_00847 TaxID=2975850 RepID=UPI00224E6A0F|nr:alpha/beta fold hydrolase [Streptomyces sp. NBC_00847]MCX4882338.1 lysophospholipase [Streptomyces sp. NBC_00847]